MRVLRGRDPRPAADRAHTAALLADASDGTPGVRVWRPPRQIAFGRRDARDAGFKRAKRLAADRGFEPIERDVGGRAVVYPGDTLAFAHAIPLSDRRNFGSIADRYERATEAVIGALRSLGADVSRGEPPESFCPGDHSVRVAGGGKIAGIAQRVRRGSVLVAGCLVVTRADARAIADTTAAVYDTLGVPFDPASVGSVAEAGGPGDPELAAQTLENAFVGGPWGDSDPQIDRIDRSD